MLETINYAVRHWCLWDEVSYCSVKKRNTVSVGFEWEVSHIVDISKFRN